jgi:hypothetical protein
MAGASNVVRAKLRAWLEVDVGNTGWKNSVEFDISSMSLNFGLNKIPVASCTVAIGRETTGGGQANIHDYASTFVETKPARLWLDPTGYFSATDSAGAWSKAGPQMVFDGYIAGLGYKRTERSTIPVVMLVHWLSDLAFSSVLSENSHPGNPAKFRWRDNPVSDNALRAEGLDEFIQSHFNGGVARPQDMMGSNGDLWSKVIYRAFVDLSSTDVLNQLGTDRCVAMGTTNHKIKTALARLETSAGAERYGQYVDGNPSKSSGASSPYYVPLRLASGAMPQIAAESIHELISRQTLNSYFNSTCWDKLIGELAPTFSFSVVPRVKTAIVCPFVPGLQQTFQAEIDFKDISDWSSSFSSVRPLRGVGVLPGNLSPYAGSGNSIPVNVLGGCFAPDENKHGLIIFKRPPPWLERMPLHAHEPGIGTKGIALEDGTLRGVSTFSPQAPAALNAERPTSPSRAANAMEDYYKRSAQYLYAQEMLRGRYAVLQGKLRFDLAPGTTVFIRNSPPRFLEGDQFGLNLIGSISRTSIIIDAESATANTSFQVDYIRTEAENDSLSTSVPKHPLYELPFVGAPLIHEYLFA